MNFKSLLVVSTDLIFEFWVVKSYMSVTTPRHPSISPLISIYRYHIMTVHIPFLAFHLKLSNHRQLYWFLHFLACHSNDPRKNNSHGGGLGVQVWVQGWGPGRAVSFDGDHYCGFPKFPVTFLSWWGRVFRAIPQRKRLIGSFTLSPYFFVYFLGDIMVWWDPYSSSTILWGFVEYCWMFTPSIHICGFP